MSFENSIVWQKSRQLVHAIYDMVQLLPDSERFGLTPQICRAATSVMANIAEGWGRESRRDKAHFLAIAQGSLDELRSHLIVCCDRRWFDRKQIAPVFSLMTEIGRMLTVIRRKFRNSSG